MHRNLGRALALGAILTLILPSTVLGVASTQTRSESVLVLSSITLTGLPSTPLVWTASVPGTTLTDAPSPIVVASDNPAGYTVNMTHNVFTSSGAATIPLSAQKVKIATAVVAADLVVTAAYKDVFGVVSGAGSLVAVTCGPICVVAGASQTYTFTEQLVIPVGQAPANYSSTLVYAALTL